MADVATRRRRPGRAWYGVGVAILVVGLGVGGWLVGGVAPGIVRDMPRLEVPGEGLIEFRDAGRFTVFDDRPRGVPRTLPPVSIGGGGLELTAVAERTGAEATLTSLPGSLDYTLAGRQGDGIGVLVVPEPGTYLVRTSVADDGAAGTIAIDAAGAMGVRFVGTFLAGFVLGGAAIPLGALALVLVAWLRHRRPRTPHAPPPPPPPSPPRSGSGGPSQPGVALPPPVASPPPVGPPA
jgi:hypothetical protein